MSNNSITLVCVCITGPPQITSKKCKNYTQILMKVHKVILVTIIEIIPFFLNLTTYFQIYGTFKFYENVNLRVNGLYKNPNCTKTYKLQNNFNHLF